MSIIERIGIAFLTSFFFLFFTLDHSAAKYYETLLLWGLGLAMMILPFISLHSNKTKRVIFNGKEEPIPQFLISTKNRQTASWVMMTISLLIFFSYMGISSSLDSKESYEFALRFENIFLLPSIIFLLWGAYFATTNQCPYCCKFNFPNNNEDVCYQCENLLEDSWLQDFF